MTQANYLQVIPNSHSFGSLRNIISMSELKLEEDNFNREYLLIGFKNTLKREYEITQIDKPVNAGPIFPSLKSIIKYLEQPDSEFNIDDFMIIISNTLVNGIDLKPLNTLERREVYQHLDIEREYQDLRRSIRNNMNDVPDIKKPVSEWINYMEWHLNKAKDKNYMLDKDSALSEIRKVAALAVRCLEIHGCPERIIPVELLNDENI